MACPDNHTTEAWVGQPGIEIAVLDAEGVIIAVNGPWTDFCEANEGNPATTGVGVNYLDVCQEAGSDPDAQRVAGAIRSALRGAAPVAERIQISCHSPSEPRWFDVFVTSRIGDGGEPIGATVMLHQVPEPHVDVIDADRSLAWDLLGVAPDALVMADAEGVVESINRAGEHLFGCRRGELIGRPIAALLPGIAAGDALHAEQIRAVRVDGFEVPVEATVVRRDVGGKPRLIASIRDITERVRAERRTRLIDRSIDSASDAILVLDEHSLRFSHVNRGAAEMFGYERAEMIDTMSPADVAPELSTAELVTVLSTLRHHPEEHVRITTIGRTKLGRELPIEVQLDWPTPASPNGHRPVVAIARLINGL